MKVLSASLIALSMGLVGCTTEIPVAKSYPRMDQLQMQAAMHWEAVAADVAQRLASALNSGGKHTVLYVEHPAHGSTFSRAFHEMLKTELLQNGFGITDTRGNGLPLHYQIQLVGHRDRGTPPMGRHSYADHEVVVTTAVMNGDRHLTRISDVYYVNDNNYNLYLASVPASTRLVEVVGE